MLISINDIHYLINILDGVTEMPVDDDETNLARLRGIFRPEAELPSFYAEPIQYVSYSVGLIINYMRINFHRDIDICKLIKAYVAFRKDSSKDFKDEENKAIPHFEFLHYCLLDKLARDLIIRAHDLLAFNATNTYFSLSIDVRSIIVNIYLDEFYKLAQRNVVILDPIFHLLMELLRNNSPILTPKFVLACSQSLLNTRDKMQFISKYRRTKMFAALHLVQSSTTTTLDEKKLYRYCFEMTEFGTDSLIDVDGSAAITLMSKTKDFNVGCLPRTRLSGFNYSHGKFQTYDFSNIEAIATNFSDAILLGANFTETDLRFAKFRNAHLEGCIFYFADLRDADFTGAIFEKTAFFQFRVNLREFLGQIHYLWEYLGEEKFYQRNFFDAMQAAIIEDFFLNLKMYDLNVGFQILNSALKVGLFQKPGQSNNIRFFSERLIKEKFESELCKEMIRPFWN